MISPHACSMPRLARVAAFGVAIEDCHSDDKDLGVFWVGNGEYYNQVNFCPFCGEKAPKQIPIKL